jgi:hypothetical protein
MLRSGLPRMLEVCMHTTEAKLRALQVTTFANLLEWLPVHLCAHSVHVRVCYFHDAKRLT